MTLRAIAETDQPHLPGPSDARPSAGALRFFARTGHSFVAEQAGMTCGYALAQAVWQGEQVTVLITRMVGADAPIYTHLLNAVIKSAHDAGVYEVALHVLPDDQGLQAALSSSGFTVGPAMLASKRLGKAGRSGPAQGVLT